MTTDFQRACEARLLGRLTDESIQNVATKLVHGRTEDYVSGKVADVEFWIYEDGAEFRRGPETTKCTNQWIYERQDYESLEALADDFVTDLVSVLRGD